MLVPLLGAMLAAAAPGFATAQSYNAVLEPFTYTPLPVDGGTASNLNATSGLNGFTNAYKEVTLPFTVYFFNQAYTTVRVGSNGIVSFGTAFTPTSATPRVVPSTQDTLHNFVAVWWDRMVCDKAPGGNVVTQTLATTPKRWVVEWQNCYKYNASTTTGFTAQLWLTEDSEEIEVRYGPITDTEPTNFFNAAVGIENDDGTDGTPGIAACSPTCLATAFPTDHRIVYSSPSVSFDSVTVTPDPISIGTPVAVSATVRNERLRDLDDASVRFWMGPSMQMSQAQEIGVVSGLTIPGSASVAFPVPFDTSDLAPGSYFVFAEFDPFNLIFPASQPGPITTQGPITVKTPTAALRVLGGAVDAPRWVDLEGTFDVSWDMDNLDFLDVADAGFAVMLSADSTLDDDDYTLGTGTFSLPANGELSMTKTVTLPPGIPEGRYFVGVWLDPAEAIPHDDRSGNKRVAQAPTTVGVELEIVTTELPDGRVGEAYSAELVAKGGDIGSYEWTVVSGTLPAGLRIVGAGGSTRLEGTPEQAGTPTFTLQVVSADFTKTATYTVEILPALLPLEVVTNQSLPDGQVGSSYSVPLTARGGVPPYSWSLDGGALPAGMTLSPLGEIEGRPLEPGIFQFFAKVADTASSVIAPFILRVGTIPLSCADVTNLAPVTAGEPIHPVTLKAAGGLAPYEFTSVGGAVPGLGLSADGIISGTPMDAGTFDWKVQVADTLRATGTCHVNLEVRETPVTSELKIATSTLARARVMEPYTATLEATGVSGTVTWSMGVDGALPEGLSLRENGTIAGTPAEAALAGEKSRTFRFEVVAIDSAQKEARATLDLEVFDDRPALPDIGKEVEKKKDGGCQSASGDTGIVVLGLALGLVAWVRRNRR